MNRGAQIFALLNDTTQCQFLKGNLQRKHCSDTKFPSVKGKQAKLHKMRAVNDLEIKLMFTNFT